MQEVFADESALRVFLVDWDTDASDKGPGRIEFLDVRGQPVFAWVVELPISELPGDDGDQIRALTAAGIEVEPALWREGIRDPATLNRGELVDCARRVQSLLYLDIVGDREFWNPDKEWQGADLLDELAKLMAEQGLLPSSIANAPL